MFKPYLPIMTPATTPAVADQAVPRSTHSASPSKAAAPAPAPEPTIAVETIDEIDWPDFLILPGPENPVRMGRRPPRT